MKINIPRSHESYIVAEKAESNKIINNHKNKWKAVLVVNVNKHVCMMSPEGIMGYFCEEIGGEFSDMTMTAVSSTAQAKGMSEPKKEHEGSDKGIKRDRRFLDH